MFRDKRTGFDRRAPREAGVKGFVLDFLIRLRDSRRTLTVLLLTVNALNLIDFALTLNALAIGGERGESGHGLALRGEPDMGRCLQDGRGGTGEPLVWEWRRYRKALGAAVAMLVVFTAVFVYHMIGLALFN